MFQISRYVSNFQGDETPDSTGFGDELSADFVQVAAVALADAGRRGSHFRGRQLSRDLLRMSLKCVRKSRGLLRMPLKCATILSRPLADVAKCATILSRPLAVVAEMCDNFVATSCRRR
jgi:hypothetical protein